MELHYSREIRDRIEAAYQRKKETFSDLMSEIDNRIRTIAPRADACGNYLADPGDLRDSMKFIFAHLPVSDIAEEGIVDTVLDYAKTALLARAQMPWGKDVPVDIFLADVLFPRVNNEWLEPVRRQFYDMLCERVRDKTMAEAIIETNYFCFEQATYVGSDMRTAPPSTLLKSAQGRCGEESVFAIMALRSIGIPARQIYVPRWAHCDSNHAWVEVWCDGQWHYLGACEPEEVLDRGWFTSAASRAMLVESKAFYYAGEAGDAEAHRGPAGGVGGEEAVKTGLIWNVNRTAHYAPAGKLVVSVTDAAGGPMEGLSVVLEIINAAGYSPIGVLITDEQGQAEITIGKGTVHLHVTDGRSFMERWVDTGAVSHAGLVWAPCAPEQMQERTVEFDTMAPLVTGVTNRALDEAAIREQKARTEQALRIRKNKEAAFFDGGDEAVLERFADIIDRQILRDILIKARGNYQEIVDYLAEHHSRYAALLLTTLNDKDYSDCHGEILAAHLKHAAAYAGRWNEDMFVHYVLAPRVYYEPMTDYRDYLTAALTDSQKEQFTAAPGSLWEYIETHITYLEAEGTANLIATPAAVVRSGLGSLIAKKILFVAVLRSLGIPARVTKETLHIEYYDGSEFVQVTKDEVRDSQLKIRFTGDNKWIYGFNWSVSVLQNGVFEGLDLSGLPREDGGLKIWLTHGCYRVVTSNRLPNGNTYSRQYDVVLQPGARRELEISLRPISEEDMVSRAKINDFGISELGGAKSSLAAVMAKGQNVLLWLAEDHEPSQHVLNEMMALQDYFREHVHVVFLLGSARAAQNGLISRTAEALRARVVVDAEFANAEPAARMTFVDPDKLPLAIVADEQFDTIYAISGYNVGTAEMLIKILDRRTS